MVSHVTITGRIIPRKRKILKHRKMTIWGYHKRKAHFSRNTEARVGVSMVTVAAVAIWPPTVPVSQIPAL